MKVGGKEDYLGNSVRKTKYRKRIEKEIWRKPLKWEGREGKKE